MEFRANRDFAWDGIALWLIVSQSDGKRRVVESLQSAVKEHQEGDYIEPSMRLNANEAQSLMEALWGAGLRPAEARYPADHVNALRDHLADMRRLVFDVSPKRGSE